jgi:imidazolonepropionase-like amidohydrolase
MQIQSLLIKLFSVLFTSLWAFNFSVTAQTPKGNLNGGQQITAFVNVNVVSMDSERVLSGQTVIVRDGRIVEIGAAAQVKIPEGTMRIDGQGKYLMPGLVDMHVHGFDDEEKTAAKELFLYIAYGVTTVHHRNGKPKLLKLREQVKRGHLPAPTLFISSPIIFGEKSLSLFGDTHDTPESARKAVVEYAKDGYDSLKVYGDWKLEPYQALVEEAAKQKIPVMGHFARNLPLEVNLRGRVEVAHAEEYIYTYFFKVAKGDWTKRESLIPEVAKATKEAGVAVTANLSTYKSIGLVIGDDTFKELLKKPELKYVPQSNRARLLSERNGYRNRKQYKPEQAPVFAGMTVFLKKLVKAMQDEGVKILLGTDAGFEVQAFTIPGISAHEELRELVDAGLTPYQAILAGTRNAAEVLGAANEFGTVSVGRRADLILVEGNPLEDINQVSKQSGVMIRGRWLTKVEVQKRLDEIAASFAK